MRQHTRPVRIRWPFGWPFWPAAESMPVPPRTPLAGRIDKRTFSAASLIAPAGVAQCRQTRGWVLPPPLVKNAACPLGAPARPRFPSIERLVSSQCGSCGSISTPASSSILTAHAPRPKAPCSGASAWRSTKERISSAVGFVTRTSIPTRLCGLATCPSSISPSSRAQRPLLDWEGLQRRSSRRRLATRSSRLLAFVFVTSLSAPATCSMLRHRSPPFHCVNGTDDAPLPSSYHYILRPGRPARRRNCPRPLVCPIGAPCAHLCLLRATHESERRPEGPDRGGHRPTPQRSDGRAVLLRSSRHRGERSNAALSRWRAERRAHLDPRGHPGRPSRGGAQRTHARHHEGRQRHRCCS